jgi:hypothetical protein
LSISADEKNLVNGLLLVFILLADLFELLK